MNNKEYKKRKMYEKYTVLLKEYQDLNFIALIILNKNSKWIRFAYKKFHEDIDKKLLKISKKYYQLFGEEINSTDIKIKPKRRFLIFLSFYFKVVVLIVKEYYKIIVKTSKDILVKTIKVKNK